ncbi:HEAT repeat domain-containing protein [Corallococcus sp. 4LFB]|uniref:HEAT repeat domain-containing protein n=1 Tax=Corallococcus sp. 4LFB TaxID=3383249 RepID=UPI003976015D
MTGSTVRHHPLSLSADDRARVEEVEQLARQGPASLPVLVDGLDAPSWAVRRAVVSALGPPGHALRGAPVRRAPPPPGQRGAHRRRGGRAGGRRR